MQEILFEGRNGERELFADMNELHRLRGAVELAKTENFANTADSIIQTLWELKHVQGYQDMQRLEAELSALTTSAYGWEVVAAAYLKGVAEGRTLAKMNPATAAEILGR